MLVHAFLRIFASFLWALVQVSTQIGTYTCPLSIIIIIIIIIINRAE